MGNNSLRKTFSPPLPFPTINLMDYGAKQREDLAYVHTSLLSSQLLEEEESHTLSFFFRNRNGLTNGFTLDPLHILVKSLPTNAPTTETDAVGRHALRRPLTRVSQVALELYVHGKTKVRSPANIPYGLSICPACILYAARMHSHALQWQKSS